jgi:hypothetical protein
MIKHLQNLQRLCQKMQARYGDGDDFVRELKQEITLLEARKSNNLVSANHGRRKYDRIEPTPPLH